MGRILQDIYSTTSIAGLLGLKGGTCAYIFYGLPRFSVDLDFDLFATKQEILSRVGEAIQNIARRHCQIKQSQIKRHTLFWLLTYREKDRNIKIEINTRLLIPSIEEHFELKDYLGISMMVGKKPYLFASKLAALTTRKEIAMRDIYDIWFFAKEIWDIDEKVVRLRTGQAVKPYLEDCISIIEEVKDNQILQGLGELLGEKEKVWVKNKLRSETVLMLKAYRSALN